MIDKILQDRPDLTREDIYDIIDSVSAGETLEETVEKFYPLNKVVGECGS